MRHRAAGNERSPQHFYLPKHYPLPKRGGVWRLLHNGFKAIDAMSRDMKRRFPQEAGVA